jgi:putative transcriptional regulator
MTLLLAALARILSARAAPSGTPPSEPGLVRFYAGYAGWGAGQLAAELELGSWIVCPATAAEVFAADVEHLWEEVLQRLGPDFARLITVPLDPRVN